MSIHVPSQARQHVGASRAFTLIELLVVVSIIALLVSMLLPTLNQAKEQARKVYCMNNLGAIAKSLNIYASDWNAYPFNYFTSYVRWCYPNVGWKEKWALACLSKYMGGPSHSKFGLPSNLTNHEEGEFPKAYVCPNVDKGVVFHQDITETRKYHASYWTNPAVRVNDGWGYLYNQYSDQTLPRGDDNDSGGLARYYGNVCPGVEHHFRSVYHPTPESVNNPEGMAFAGDTSNGGYYHPDSAYECVPGEWYLEPGFGKTHGCFGFDRHQDEMAICYVDAHAAMFPKARLVDCCKWTPTGTYQHALDTEATGDFLVNYVGDDGCKGTRIHTLVPPVYHIDRDD